MIILRQKEFAMPLKPGMATANVKPMIPKKVVSTPTPTPQQGIINPNGVQNARKFLIENNKKPTTNNIKQLVGREMQEVKQTGPTRFGKTAKRLSKYDLKFIKKYTPKV